MKSDNSAYRSFKYFNSILEGTTQINGAQAISNSTIVPWCLEQKDLASVNRAQGNDTFKVNFSPTSQSLCQQKFASSLLEKDSQSSYLPANRGREPLKILIVEDEPKSRNFLCKILEAENCQVIVAQDSNTAIELALFQIPDLIICELRMPVLDGYGITYHLRNFIFTKNIPLLFITAHSIPRQINGEAILIVDGDTIELLTPAKLITTIAKKVQI